jgi:hypothetical protein
MVLEFPVRFDIFPARRGVFCRYFSAQIISEFGYDPVPLFDLMRQAVVSGQARDS